MRPLQARVDLGVIAIKMYSAFPKAPALLEPHHQIILVSYPGHSLGESYPSAEMQSVYSEATADWAKCTCQCTNYCNTANHSRYFPWFERLELVATPDDGLWRVWKCSGQFWEIHLPIPRILIKLYRQNLSLLFNETCLNERLLPNYTHTHTYIYIFK